MPPLDLFHPPVSLQTFWESFHAKWAVAMAGYLNGLLPRRYAAEVQIHLGRQAEADMAEFDQGFSADDISGNGTHLAGGVAVATWAPPTPAKLRNAIFPDDIEVYVNDLGVGGARLVAVVELASPGNKDRPEARRAFAIKTAAYLQRGIGVVIVDAVTSKHFNLHHEFLDLIGHGEETRMAGDDPIYSAAYRPGRRDDENQIDVWTFPLTVGQPLPIVPLALRATTTVPLDLELTYSEARRNSRLD